MRAALFALLGAAFTAAVICCGLLWLGTLECLDQCGPESVPEWLAAGASTVAVGALVLSAVPYGVLFGLFN